RVPHVVGADRRGQLGQVTPPGGAAEGNEALHERVDGVQVGAVASPGRGGGGDQSGPVLVAAFAPFGGLGGDGAGVLGRGLVLPAGRCHAAGEQAVAVPVPPEHAARPMDDVAAGRHGGCRLIEVFARHVVLGQVQQGRVL